ncbi:MAG: long-chain fatty acid--CoA ligase [Lewinella sp.]|nr:long-chain fatty acid--CoA ligase [Lewinella sp.]
MNQYDWAAKWARYRPDQLAFSEYESGRSLTFGELHRLGNRLAHHLTVNYHIGKGDRVALLAENSLEYLILFAAAQKTGCILVPLNYRLASAEIDYLLASAQPGLVITEAKFQEKIERSTHYHQVPFQLSWESLKQLCGKQNQLPEDDHFSTVPLRTTDPIFLLYTSGTTGFPKGALYTHQMLFWNSINTSLSLIVNTDSRTINCMPPFHTGGWNVLTTPFFHHGGYSCLMKSFDARAVLHAIEQEQVTIFMGVPTMLRMMADLPEFACADLSSLHYIIVGGEPMPIPLIEQWHEKGVPIRQGFGMTEAGPNLTSLHQDDAIRKMGSIGRPNFYVESRIVDEQGRTCPLNQAGELQLRGPMIIPGYWQNPPATEKAFIDGWFRTGDRVRQDEEGYLFVVDRIKNMYISGGENVYPAEVERILLSHPGVHEAVVIGVPDAKWGESGRAFIVKQAAVSEQELIDFCVAHLAKFKVPKSVVFLEALPKNDTGKINRQGLKEWKG